MKKLLFFILLLIDVNLMAQDPVSSQFYMNQLNLNPAFAGFKKNARVGLNYRNQWTGIPSKLNTYNFWGDISIPAMLDGGLGIIALQDVSGEGFLKTTSFGLVQSLEYCIKPKILKIRFGANLTVTNKRINWDKLVFSDQLDGMYGQMYSTAVVPGRSEGKTFFDPAAGIILSWIIPVNKTKITNILGYSINHLTKPNEGLSGSEDRYLPRKHTFHGTIDIEINDRLNQNTTPFSISPNFIFEQQANFTTTNVGFYMGRKQFIVGFFIRNRKVTNFKDDDSGIIFLGVHQKIGKTNALRIGFSYDMTINNLGVNTRGSHEISISWEFNDKERGPGDCPREKIDPCQCPNPFFY